MADDLELLMRRSEGEGPSAEFVARLREQIVAESSPPTIVSTDEPILETATERTRTESPPILRRLLAVAAVATAIVIAGAVIATIATNDGTSTTHEATSLDPNAQLLTADFELVDPGVFFIDSVGTPFTFAADQPFFVALNRQARFALGHPDSQGVGDRELLFARLSALSDPSQPTIPVTDLDETWPVDDFEGWLDNASAQVVITDREATTVGGLDAIRVDLELGETDCQIGSDQCAYLGINQQAPDHGYNLLPGAKYRIWLVEQGDEDPLLIGAAVDRAADVDWFDTADAIVSTVAFGNVGSNPIIGTSAGSNELPFLGGIRIDIESEGLTVRDRAGFGRATFDPWAAHTTFLTNPLDLDGAELATADDLARALRTAGIDVAEIESAAVDGFEARVFDAVGDPSEPALKLEPDEQRAWPAPRAARLWVVEHPDRGLLVIVAVVDENVDIVLPLITERTQAIVDSLQFVDLS